ncbi:hypothetical protein BB561_005867 [Smittium simulii]|uniref:Uncharacterized protein n=1 Tax=Smittium simulii TaxID=133385 RepID=A0A2T9Y7Z8_9FUNG|nr:hypothetical protein BB561_005867 [Smittium simulii]
MYDNKFRITRNVDFTNTTAVSNSSYFPVGLSSMNFLTRGQNPQNQKKISQHFGVKSLALDQPAGDKPQENLPTEVIIVKDDLQTIDFEDALLLTIQGRGIELFDHNTGKIVREYNISGKIEFATEAKFVCSSNNLNEASNPDSSDPSLSNSENKRYVYAAILKANDVSPELEGKEIWRWSILENFSNSLPDLVKLPKTISSRTNSTIFELYPILLKQKIAILTIYNDAYISVYDQDLKQYLFGFNTAKQTEYLQTNLKVIACQVSEVAEVADTSIIEQNSEAKSSSSNQQKKTVITLVVKINKNMGVSTPVDSEVIVAVLELSHNKKKISMVKLVSFPKINCTSLAGVYLNHTTNQIYAMKDNGKLVYGKLERDNTILVTPLETCVNYKVLELYNLNFSKLLGLYNNKMGLDGSKVTPQPVNAIETLTSIKPVSFLILENDIVAIFGMRLDSNKVLSHVITIYSIKYNATLNELWIPDETLDKVIFDKKTFNSNKFYSDVKIIFSDSSSSSNLGDSTGMVYEVEVIHSVGKTSKNKSTSWVSSIFSVAIELPPVSLLSLIELHSHNLESNIINKYSKELQLKTFESEKNKHLNKKNENISHDYPVRELQTILKFNRKFLLYEYEVVLKFFKKHITKNEKILIPKIADYLSSDNPSPLFISTITKLIIDSLDTRSASLNYLTLLLDYGLISYYSVSGEFSILKKLGSMLITGRKINRKILKAIIQVTESVKDIPSSEFINIISIISDNFNKKKKVISKFYSTPRVDFCETRNKRTSIKPQKYVNVTSMDQYNFILYKKLIANIVNSSTNQLMLIESLESLSSFAVALLLNTLESWLYDKTLKVLPLHLDESLARYLKKYSHLDFSSNSTTSIEEILNAELGVYKQPTALTAEEKMLNEIPNEQKLLTWLGLIFDTRMNTIMTDQNYKFAELRLRLDLTIANITEKTKFLTENVFPWLHPLHAQFEKASEITTRMATESSITSSRDSKAIREGKQAASKLKNKSTYTTMTPLTKNKNNMLKTIPVNSTNDYVIETINW